MAPLNLKLTLEYDGTGFAGWQVQPGQRTVQGVLEDALADLVAEVTDGPAGRVPVVGAGRTDAGVHALGQVASASVELDLEPERVAGALNARLPRDVLVKDAHRAPESFHARFSAASRNYLYLMSLEESAVWRDRRWFVRHELDLGRMKASLRALEGEHDFSSFCIAGSEPDHHRCRVSAISLEWEPSFGGTLAFRIEANRFLRGMVRSIVGTLVDVGRGRTEPSELAVILEARDRGRAGATAPAHGLYLASVSYDE